MDITLYHYDFESDNQNILLFSNATQRDTYFAGISDKKTIQNINFFANDIMQTKVYVGVDDLSLFSLLNYNYAIITNSTGETTQKPLFFYIKNSRQDSGGQIELSLECDIANTYFYDVDMTKWQGIIERAHLDRIIQPNILNDVYVYAYGENSKLYEREKIKDTAKRVVQRKPLYFEIDKTANSSFNQWLRDNVSCWKYYYLADNVTYDKLYYIDYDENQTHITNAQNDFFALNYITQEKIENGILQETNSNFKVICVPIYKKYNTANSIAKNVIKVRQQYENIGTTNDYMLDEYAINKFLEENNMYANVLAIKFSILPPFENELNLTYNTDYEIDANQNLIIKQTKTSILSKTLNNSVMEFYYSSTTSSPTISSIMPFVYVKKQHLFQGYKMRCNLDTTNTGIKWVFDKLAIKSNYVEPKLWNEDYAKYKLIIGGQQHDLSISKTSNEPHFIYQEILSPDITKAQLSYDVNNSNLVSENYFAQVFKEHSMRDFTGLTFTIDLSMWYPSNDLQNYLASNKNYLQIFNNQQSQKFLAGTISAVGSMVGGIATGNFTGISQGSGITAQSARNIMNLFYDKENLNLTLNNMENAPESIANINSNALLISAVQKEISIFIEVLEMLPFEKQTLIDYFKQFGYTYNRLSTIAENLRTRKFYNYIQAQIFEIPEKLGNNVKEKIKQMFANGVRFWHYDNYTGVDFTKNNYERFIDNE